MTIKVRHLVPLLAAGMLVSILLFQGYQVRTLMIDRALKDATASLQSLATRAQASLGRQFAANDLPSVHQTVGGLYVANHETESVLLDENNRVIAADRLGFEGLAVSRLPIPLDPRKVAATRSSLVGHVVVNSAGTALTAYYPVSLASRGSPEFSRVGVLIVNLDIDQLKSEVKGSVRASVFQSLFVVLALVGGVALVMHFGIIRRLNRMLDVNGRYAHGDLLARNQDVREDEIGQLSRAFNHVADVIADKQSRLEQSEAQLREFNAMLEKRIEDRTLELSRAVEQIKQAEELAIGREKELSSILNLAPDGIAVIDRNGIVVTFNQAAERMFGWSAEELIGKNINTLMPEPHHADHDGYLRNYQRTGEAKVIGYEREVDAAHRDGRLFPIAVSVSEFVMRGETHYVGILRDITERRATAEAIAAAQQRLLETEKMAALGGLVAGVAHEINTPVGVSVTAISHLHDQIDGLRTTYQAGQMKRSELEAFLATCGQASEIILDNLVRASDLIRSFKEVAVDQAGDDIRTINIDEYLGRVLTSLQPRLKNRPIDVVRSVEPSDLKVALNVGGLSQVVTNLVLNSLTHAFDAEASGEIRLEVRQRGKGVTIVYTDSGRGMPQDVVDHIFEPFFTTKRGHGGSGLGMHIVYNIVTQKFGGLIECSSKPGKGTRFDILIPDCIVP